MPLIEYRMPDIGEGLADVEIVKWLVRAGDTVTENDPIAEVETDKAVVTIPAPASGRVTALAAEEGQRLAVGAVLLTVETAALPPPAAGPPGPQPEPHPPGGAAEPSAPGGMAKLRAAPAVRKLALDLHVRLESVEGTGAGGRITLEDVKRQAAQPGRGRPAPATSPAAVARPAPDEAGVERVPLRGIRRRVAEAMVQSAGQIPHVSGFQEFDAEALVALRARLGPEAEAGGVHLTFLPLIVRATVLALRAHPYLNASFDASEHAVLLKKTYHIGIATATEGGLVVPVVHHADRLAILDLARRIEDVVRAARQQRLTPGDLAGGTFTVTNVGPAGGWFGTSIIRFPEVAILGVGRVEERAVVRHGRIVPSPVLPLSLTFDHRVVDGEMGLAFMQTLRTYLERPDPILVESPSDPSTGR
jgi:pyruvate dehydrogenase E2 component (dihydrolipoamide acetyltransferase)